MMKLFNSKAMLMLIFVASVPAVTLGIVLGQSCALSGPAKGLGIELNKGAEAYFKSVSEISISKADDKYEPKKCIANTEKFVGDKNIAALFGYVGTPTSKVAAPIAMKNKKIYFGPFTGAGFLSDHVKNPYSFSVRASYDQETKSMVDHLIADRGIKNIAVFIQDDGFGEVGKSGVVKGLAAHGLKIVGEGRYKRNTIAVKKGADAVLALKPGAIIQIGAYKPCATAVKYLRKKGFKGPIIDISFVGSMAFSKALGKYRDDVFVTQVVPNPWDTSLAIVKEYHKAIGGKANSGFVSLEGYIDAKIFHLGYKKAAGDYSSDGFKKAFESLNVDIGGLKVEFSPTDHRGLGETYLTAINPDGSFKYVEKM